MGHFIQLSAADGKSIPAYVAQPTGAVKGAVVVIQEIFGVNSHIRNVVDGYAQSGYLAIAPAAFERVKSGVELGYTEADMGEGFGHKTAVEALPAPGVLPTITVTVFVGSQANAIAGTRTKVASIFLMFITSP